MNFKYLYKIHAISTVNDYAFDNSWLEGNTRFYETYEEAEAACRKYCQDPSSEGFVIYKKLYI